MKIFVTGGTGFVGANFIKHAIEAGHEVIALKRKKSTPRIKLNGEPVWIEGELDGEFCEIFNGVELYVHFASHTPNPPYANLDECLYWNVYASLKLAKQAAKEGVNKFIIIGSCFEYGNAESDGRVYTTTELLPTSSYPTSKAAASIAFQGFCREENIKLKILRLFQVYGEGEQTSRFWPSLKAAAIAGDDFSMTKGEQVRDFISVDQVAEILIQHINFNCEVSGVPAIFHVATGLPKTLRAFAEEWWSKFEARGHLKIGYKDYRENELMSIYSGSK